MIYYYKLRTASIQVEESFRDAYAGAPALVIKHVFTLSCRVLV